MKIPASELNMTHIGKTATVATKQTTITGTIRSVSHEADIIDDTSFGDNGVTRWAIGSTKTTVTILPDHTIHLGRNAEVELEDTLTQT